MSGIGSTDRPFVNDEPLTLARGMADTWGKTENGKRGLWRMPNGWWVWEGNKWKVKGTDKLEREVWRWLDGKWFVKREKEGQRVLEKVRVGRGLVSDVVAALDAVCEGLWEKLPTWDDGVGPDAERCVGFEDVVLSVGGNGVEVVEKRTERWVDGVVVPVKWEEEAECPRWMQALEEWGNGDKEWGRLLQWCMGYSLLGWRGYAKWLLMQGKSRAGKGVIAHVWKKMLGGECWFETGMQDLANDFGLDGVEGARVLSISEFYEAETATSAKVSRVMKNVIGEDGVTVNVKYERQRRVKESPLVVVQSNMMPKLPNESEGISSKMLVLPFTVSFRDGGERAPDFGLKAKLEKEMAGIAAWAVRGAVEMERKGGLGWPRPAVAAEVEKSFRIKNNPMDAFLEARFKLDPEGFVPSEMLWQEWRQWVDVNQVQMRVSRNYLGMRLESDSTWKLWRGRRKVGEEQVRGVFGIALRKVVDDEV